MTLYRLGAAESVSIYYVGAQQVVGDQHLVVASVAFGAGAYRWWPSLTSLPRLRQQKRQQMLGNTAMAYAAAAAVAVCYALLSIYCG
jgi:hypothetical protein